MCGINGIILFDQNSEVKRDNIMQMNHIIRHRGPDGQGIYLDKNIGLGAVRLSIIDLDHGAQPFVSEEGNYVIVFNGEIYNYLELRSSLIQKGYKFQTNSDTEVLLKMYIEYKEKCLDQLNGMFAFMVYDLVNGLIFVARDRIGIKPVYYYQDKDKILITSEIKSFIKTGLLTPEIDYEGLLDYLYFQFPLGNKTLFKGVKQLEPANYMIIKTEKREVNIKEYWHLNYEIQNDEPDYFYHKQILNKIKDSIQLQLRSDVPIGTHLSGGIDSSVVSMFASELSSTPMFSFTGTFKDYDGYDETNYAKLVARKFNIQYHETNLTFQDFKNNLSKIIYHLDYPVVGPGVFPQYMVNKLIHEKNIKVVLGGQGGDELFGGYTRYIIAYFEQCIKGSIYDSQDQGKYIVTLQSIIPNLQLLQNYVPLLKKFWSKNLFYPMDQRYFDLICRMDEVDKMINFNINYDPKMKFMEVFHSAKSKSYIDKMLHFDMKTLLLGLLHAEDRVSMAWSVESRVPLLDHRLIEFTAAIPPMKKFKDGNSKLLLKESVKGLLPDEILNRKDKMGFPVPIAEWFNNELKDWLQELLLSENTRLHEIIKKDYILSKIENNQKFSRELWGLVCLEIWLRTFF